MAGEKRHQGMRATLAVLTAVCAQRLFAVEYFDIHVRNDRMSITGGHAKEVLEQLSSSSLRTLKHSIPAFVSQKIKSLLEEACKDYESEQRGKV